jgi:CDP-glucose 4,6-dehydratase
MTIASLRDFYSGRTVVVTGHSGFKGSWLTLWLASLGAKVIGVSLPPPHGQDNLFNDAGISNACASHWHDIRDFDFLAGLFRERKPDFVFHLAAQSLVRPAYRDPLFNFSTNIVGTANVLEAARLTPSVRALVCVTTDKVYENLETQQPFRETDPLGGFDPYSASKAAAEMVARSYMTVLHQGDGPLAMATARGGNVVGGGDWSEDRIVPDLIRALRRGESLAIRHPHATRPWQHVAELCFGYMLLAFRLAKGWPARGQSGADFRTPWNFGPDAENETSVQVLVSRLLAAMGKADFALKIEPSPLHESTYLRLDNSKAKTQLGWRPLLTFDETIAWTADWYSRVLAEPSAARAQTEMQIKSYEGLLAQAPDTATI